MAEKFIRDALMLWTTVDPISTLAIFAAMAAGLTPQERRRTALKATLYASLILIGAIVIGQILLSAMGIALVSLQVAGGTILFLFALQMIFTNMKQEKRDGSEADHDLAVFPLAVPTIAGAGAIMAVIVLTDNHLYSIPVQLGTAAIMIAILVVTYGLMLASTPVLRAIGNNGAELLVRVMGLILAALSVELVFQALGIEKWAAAIS